VPKLLDMISLKGAIVTADALNRQRTISAKVVGKRGDYVVALKGNQDTLFDDVRAVSR
jgi:predicted transposase YbfD/YdcC